MARILIERVNPVSDADHGAPSPPAAVRDVLDRLRAADHLVLLLDYDGTLVPFAGTPDLAVPDPELLSLLRGLATRPRTDVHIVSGRRRETLERWLGSLPVGLHAEHGSYSRPPGAREWAASGEPPTDWREPVLAILNDFAARTPGSLVEEKTASVAWHFRRADPEYGALQANELTLHLAALLSHAPVEILSGEKVVEVRPHGAHKGRIVGPFVGGMAPGAVLVAMGDDRTDEDLFAAVPAGAVSIHVGPGASAAPLRLASPDDARAFLRGLLE